MEGSLLSCSRRGDDALTVGPDDRQWVVHHSTAPCKTSPSDVDRRRDLEDDIVTTLRAGISGKREPKADTLGAGVGLERDACLLVGRRDRVLSDCFKQADGSVRSLVNCTKIPIGPRLTKTRQASNACSNCTQLHDVCFQS